MASKVKKNKINFNGKMVHREKRDALKKLNNFLRIEHRRQL